MTLEDCVIQFGLKNTKELSELSELVKNNVYFMLDRKFVSCEHFPLKMTALQWEDAYQIFYGKWDKVKLTWVDSLEDRAKKIKGVKVIQKRIF
jgi:hypothetical protein